MRIVLTTDAQREIGKLDTSIQKRILDKLEWYAEREDPLSFAEPLTGMPGLFRFRVGAYRIVVTPDGIVILVLRIRKRSEAYR